MTIFWILIAIALLVTELLTVSFFFVHIGFGAAFAAIISLLTGNFIVQIIFFAIFSYGCYVFIRPKMLKYFKANQHAPLIPKKHVMDSIVGSTAIVMKRIGDDDYGQVKMRGTLWNASACSEGSIDVNTPVVVKKIEGSKLVVEKIENL